VTFSVEKESQLTNVVDSHPIWMIDIVWDRQIEARRYFSKIHLRRLYIQREQTIYHLYRPIIILSG
jgi:hypothetical protein